MFGKIFTQIFDSSLADNPQTRWVFMDLLVLADQNGVVDMTREAIARRTNVPLEVVTLAIKELESEDEKSRSNVFRGVRLKRLDDHRDWGWIVVNYEKYRDIANSSMYREVNRNKVQAVRDKMSESKGTAAIEGYVYYMADGEEIKIGHSLNPWARLKELQIARPNIKIVATEVGGKALEKQRHDYYGKLRISGEWFAFAKELKDFVRSVITNPIVVASEYEFESASAYESSVGGDARGGVQKPIRKPFTRPCVDDMISYGSALDPKLPISECLKCFNYYESNGWKVGRNPMKDWKAAMVNWRSNWLERTGGVQAKGEQSEIKENIKVKVL